jgi:hypothetical protein
LYSLASIGMWFFLSQQVRYLTPVFAPLAVVLAVGLAAASSPLVRIGGGIFVALALIGNLYMHVPLAQVAFQVVSGQVSEREYLIETLPGLYEASEEWVNKLPADSRVALYQENRGFYFDRSYFWANDLHHNMIPYDRLQNGNELADELRKFGITHVLFNLQFDENTKDSKWHQLLMDAVKKERLRPVFQSQKHDQRHPPVVGYVLQ